MYRILFLIVKMRKISYKKSKMVRYSGNCHSLRRQGPGGTSQSHELSPSSSPGRWDRPETWRVRQNVRYSTFPHPHSGPAEPAEEVPLPALVDLGVLGELLVTDLQNSLSKNRTVYSLQIFSPDTSGSSPGVFRRWTMSRISVRFCSLKMNNTL